MSKLHHSELRYRDIVRSWSLAIPLVAQGATSGQRLKTMQPKFAGDFVQAQEASLQFIIQVKHR